LLAIVPVAPRRALATATGAQRFQPSVFGPVIHFEPSAAPGRAAGVDTDFDEEEETVAGVPIVVVLVTVLDPPEVLVDVAVVTPVLLLTVLLVVVVLGADVTGFPLRRK
jgi:hypothetical protein